MPNHAEIYRRYPEQYHQLIAAQPDLRHVMAQEQQSQLEAVLRTHGMTG